MTFTINAQILLLSNCYQKAKINPSLYDIEVNIHYPHENSEVNRVVIALHSLNIPLMCKKQNTEYIISTSDIYYIESVDKKTFVYLEKDVLLINKPLYQLLEDLKSAGFVQISKSCLLNINALEKIRPLFNNHMEAYLSNDEKLLITKKYLSNIKNMLNGEES